MMIRHPKLSFVLIVGSMVAVNMLVYAQSHHMNKSPVQKLSEMTKYSWWIPMLGFVVTHWSGE